MKSMQKARVAPLFVALMLAEPVPGQDSLDLGEADARDDAYEMMAAAEKRFGCKLEERSMRMIGTDADVRYVFYVKAEGDECRAALVYATNLAARDEKILFRQVQPEDQPDAADDLPDPLWMPDDNALIHEVNPEVDGLTPVGE